MKNRLWVVFLLKELAKILESRKLVLAIINLAGFLFGICYYWHQLSTSPFYLWIFIIDCPLYVVLFALICFLLYEKREVSEWLRFLTAVGLIKYGLWTGIVIILYRDYFFAANPLLYALLFPLHIGMILEGISRPLSPAFLVPAE